jgi:D-hexose-6-phosphate mutarotase
MCFPQFGPGKMQQHGFARNSTWTIVSTSADVQPDYPEPAVLLELSDNAYTRGMWDCAFRMSYEVTLRRGGLKVELRVRNTDSKEWDFTAALHSYIGVLDAANPAVSVLGMQGKTFLDKVRERARTTLLLRGLSARLEAKIETRQGFAAWSLPSARVDASALRKICFDVRG